MNTFFMIYPFHILLRKLSIGVVSLVIFVAPLIALPANVAAEIIDPTLEQQTQSTEQNPDTLISTTPTEPISQEQVSSPALLEPEQNEIVPNPTPTDITLDDQSLSQPESSTSDPGIQSTIDANVENNLDSTAASGDATATSNTTVGNVLTGNTTAATTDMTLLQSSIGLSDNAQPLLFTYDIVGDVTGDILIDPGSIDTTATLPPAPLDSSPLLIDAKLQAAITNNLNLSAISGDATATENTSAGDILTGNAHVVANVVNLINSAIVANQSFIGTINIYGNLDGDILVPAEFINSLLGASTSSPELLANGSIITSVLNASIANNILSSATSGDATAISNSLTGDVSSGASKTNVTILNLTGKQTITSNMLLVFVNVLGTWTGLIFDAPAGTTSASLGGGDNTVNSDEGVGPYVISEQSNLSITNNLNLLAKSGDATAIKNSQTGDIRSGMATTSANILNIINSQISLSGWFGILFINVFGNWNGSLAVAPEIMPLEETTPSAPVANFTPPPQVFTFASAITRYARPTSFYSASTAMPVQEVASDSIEAASKDINLVSESKKSPSQSGSSAWVILGLVIVAGGIGTRYFFVGRNGTSAS